MKSLTFLKYYIIFSTEVIKTLDNHPSQELVKIYYDLGLDPIQYARRYVDGQLTVLKQAQ